eukprot:697066-Hanusia_phi.AAC.1
MLDQATDHVPLSSTEPAPFILMRNKRNFERNGRRYLTACALIPLLCVLCWKVGSIQTLFSPSLATVQHGSNGLARLEEMAQNPSTSYMVNLVVLDSKYDQIVEQGAAWRHIARSAVSIPKQEPQYIDSNPVIGDSHSLWGPSKPSSYNLPGTLPDPSKTTSSGGGIVKGEWNAETCVEPPCGFGTPQSELSGPRPGRVAGWLGRQHLQAVPHARVSTAGPGWLANIPRGSYTRPDGYQMSRHLHYVTFWDELGSLEIDRSSGTV